MTHQEFREILERKGISQMEAARRLYRSPSTVRRWISGASPIPNVVIPAIKRWRTRRTS